MEGAGPPATLPRALDVQRFAGAREQEIRALIGAIKDGPLADKFGVAALPRHLRRRAGSHKPFHGHRFRPNLKLQGKRRKLQASSDAETEAVAGEAATVAGAEPLAGVGSVTAAEQAAAAPTTATRLFTNRRMRRQPAALAEQHRSLASWSESALAGNTAVAGSSDDISGSGGTALRRLETHVWHAKRLTMEERYGWLLPAGAAGQGRGSRSFVHVAQSSALMHDASYYCPLLLRGSWTSLLCMLSTLLSPEDAALLAADWDACCEEDSSGGSSGGRNVGGWEQEVMLHQPGRYPGGAICPAQLLIAFPGSSGIQPMDTDAPASSPAGTAAAATAAAAAADVQACLWVHPAAAAEAHAALQLAAGQPQVVGSGVVSIAVIDLRRLEIRGGAADAALAVALAGATAGANQQQQQQQQQQGEVQQQGRQLKQQGKQQQQQAEEQHLQLQLPRSLRQMQHGDAVQLLLPDPRLCKPVVLGSAAASLVGGPVASAGGFQQPQQQQIDLGSLQAQPLPLSEARISSWRQQLRRQMLGLEAAPGGGSRGEPQQQAQQREEEEADQEVQRRGFCPAVLVRHDPPGDGGIPGWSLILPPGWVPPFWLAAAYAGCKPAGQREWRWLHALQQHSFFPWDHPDTASYAGLMQQQQQLRAAAMARRPKGKQMLAAPAAAPQWQHLVVQEAAGPVGPNQPKAQQGQQAQQQGQQAMENDAGASAQPTAACNPADSAGSNGINRGSSGSAGHMYVARTYAAMAAALQSSSSSSSGSGGSGTDANMPVQGSLSVAAALQQSRLMWRPKQQQAGAAAAATVAEADVVAEEAAASSAALGTRSRAAGSLCLLQAAVHPVKTGTLSEGAAIVVVTGWEARQCRHPLQVLTPRQQRRRQRELAEQRAALAEAGGDPADAMGSEGPSSSGSGSIEVGEEGLQVIGFVLSEMPRGAPRRCGAVAAVSAAAAWRLRSLQHGGAAQGGAGGILAFARNPGSAALFPVRLALAVEQAV